MGDDEPMAIWDHGRLYPVSEFTKEPVPGRPFKWWCDGEDCDGSLKDPHVHPMHGPARRVDLLTGYDEHHPSYVQPDAPS